ncbi:hypothetical protein GCM10027405_05580 [Arthrobacter alkaliphilus]|uniref:hypothetical protein n=1 Tax=Arthrobacter alkaliphilus TaxID=369936 RepID=UPI001F39DC2F|nr:hypothetical protein [Arthrobacter alkaliphilus]
MVNAILGMDQGLVQRFLNIERQLRALGTQPILLNASTGQDGGKGISTDLNGLHLYGPAGVEVIHLDTNTGTLFAVGDVGQASLTAGGSVGSTVPILAFRTFDGGGVQTAGAQVFQSYNELVIAGPSTSTNGSSNAVISAKDSGAWAKVYGSTGSGAAYLNITNTGTFYLGNWAGTAGVYTTAQNGPILVTGGLTVSGTKNFVMDHPTTPGWSLKHASTESPHNGVEYWGSGTLDSTGQAVITLPGYFEALTYPENRNIQLTPIGRATVPMSADRIANGKFTGYGSAGQEFDWLVKAVRKSTNPNEPIDFTVEGPKESTPPPAPPAPPEPGAPSVK